MSIKTALWDSYRRASAASSIGLGTVTPGNEGRMVFTLDKLSLTRGQIMRVYFYEKVSLVELKK